MSDFNASTNSDSSNMPSKFGRNLITLTGGEFISRLAYAIAFVWIARSLQTEIYGQVEFALAVMMFLVLVIDLGLGLLGTREIARISEKTQILVNRVVSIQISIAVVVITALLVSVRLLPIEETLAYLLAGYSLSLIGFPFLLNWVFQGLNLMLWFTLPQVIRQITFAVLVILLLRYPEQFWLLPIFELVSVITAVLLNLGKYFSLGNRLQLSFKFNTDRRIIKESLPIGLSQLIWTLRMYLPIILLGVFIGPVSVGFFAAPHRVIMAIQAFLIAYFVNLFPSLSIAANLSTDSLIGLLSSSHRLIVWPSIVLVITMTLLSKLIIELVYGENYVAGDASIIFAILIWMIPILVIRGHARNALIATGYQKDELISSLVGVLILCVSLLIFVPMYQGVGAAIAMTLSEFLAMIVTWLRVKIRIPEFEVIKSLLAPPSLALLFNRTQGHV